MISLARFENKNILFCFLLLLLWIPNQAKPDRKGLAAVPDRKGLAAVGGPLTMDPELRKENYCSVIGPFLLSKFSRKKII
jgi:hypothetical protein